jgi:hypothetical protein
MTYRRTTLADLGRGERLMIDVGLSFASGDRRVAGRLGEGFAIVESKSEGGSASADRLLRELGVRPVSSCSKYCIGVTLTHPAARGGNGFRPLARRYFETSAPSASR